MKLWEKGIASDAQMERFTVGRDRELDIHLAQADILGNIAHAEMLAKIGLLTAEECGQLKNELQQLYQFAEEGKLQIEEGVEDIHSQVEKLLTEKLGDVGKKIHSGRSRNDQVLVDLRLFIRREIKELTEGAQALFEVLQAQSEQHKAVLMPGYTHFQVAMPSSFGLWFGAYAESLADDLLLLQSAYRINNQNPLGSAAGYGSSFPLDRTYTTQLLGFQDLSYNVVYAQMGRGKTEKILGFAMSSLAATLGKMAMDITLFMSQNFGFLKFPDSLTTGSSIMPHKKNPDVFELMRARCNKIQQFPAEVAAITGNLPSGYHRDFQLIKESLIDHLQSLKECLGMATQAMGQATINPDILNDARYKYLFSVEKVNQAVLSGVPFREAYRQIAEDIASGKYEEPNTVHHTHEGSIGNLCTEQIKRKFEAALQGFAFEEAEKAERQLLEG